MADELFSLAKNRLEGGFESREWMAESGRVESRPLLATLQPSDDQWGPYLLARPISLSGLWGAIYQALSEKKPLVVLPPLSHEEEKVLLRQLPRSSSPGALLCLFTSGSTGNPKAVIHGVQSLLASAAQLARAFPLEHSTSLLPFWGMAGIAFHFLHPLLGGKSHLWSRSSPIFFSASLEKFMEPSSLLSLNPYSLEMWMRSNPNSWNGRVISLTAPLPPSLRSAFSAVSPACLEEVYGMSEAAGPVLLENKSLGAEVRLGAENELSLRGAQLFLGYGEEGRFQPAEEWFLTGDQFSNEMKFKGRLKELIDLGGRKIAPLLVEEIIMSLPEISQCVAFEKKIEGVSRVALLYVRQKECVLTREELSALLGLRARKSFSLEMRPAWWGEMDNLPRLPSGKVDRKKIKSEWS